VIIHSLDTYSHEVYNWVLRIEITTLVLKELGNDLLFDYLGEVWYLIKYYEYVQMEMI